MGALGCEEARADAACGFWGGASGEGAACCGARFFSNAANCPGSYFFCSSCGSFLTICFGGSGFSLGLGTSAVSTGFGSGLGSGDFTGTGGAGFGSGNLVGSLGGGGG